MEYNAPNMIVFTENDLKAFEVIAGTTTVSTTTSNGGTTTTVSTTVTCPTRS